MKIAMFLGDSENKRGKRFNNIPLGLEFMAPD